MSLDLPASSQKSPPSEADLFASLGKTAPPPSRKPPPPPVIKDADASAELELEMDDILEVEEIGDFSSPSLEGTEPHAKPPVEAPAPVAAAPAPAPAPQPAPHAQIAKPAAPTLESPVMPKTLMGMPPAQQAEPANAAPVVPPAPNTSPLPLEDLADDRLAEKTMEIRRDAVAQAAEHLADEYEGIGHTEVMVRTPELANAGKATTQKSSLHVQTPSQSLSVTAPVSARMPAAQRPSWQPHPAAGTQPMRRPSSIAPVAMDPSMPPVHSLPPQRSGMSAGMIAGLVFGAVALIGLVGAGGFAASRALSKEPTAIADESPSTPGVSTTTTTAASPASTNNVSAPAAPAEESAPAAAAPASNPAPSSAGVDVSSLPSAAPKAVTAPAHTAASTPAASPSPASHTTTSAPAKGAKSAPEKTPAAQTAAAAKVDPNAPLPPPNAANANAPLPPPNAAPAGAPLPAPAAAAPKSNVGTVHVDSNLRVVQVDGAFRRAQDGFVTVQCGPHRIKAGMSERTIDVPCGGSVNF